MSASFYDLLKYAKTGIAAPDMTAYDKLKALAMCKAGFPVKTLTGVPPITFQSDGTALTAWSISGNMVQTGTPTPTVPITPEETGDKTANLWDYLPVNSTLNGVTIINNNGVLKFSGICSSSANFQTSRTLAAGTYTIMANANRNPVRDNNACIQVLSEDLSAAAQVNNSEAMNGSRTFTLLSKKRCYLRIRIQNGVNYDGFELRIMMNAGSSALPYEPYGYKIHLTCAGQTYTAYLQEPIRKIDDSADVASAVGTVGTVNRSIKKLVFDGSEDWAGFQDAGTRCVARISLSETDAGLNTIIGYCSHIKWKASYESGDLNRLVFNTSRVIYLSLESSLLSENSFAAFKAYLADEYAAGHPVALWYVLAEPKTETFTAPTITPQKGANVLTVNTTLPPSEVSITGGIK